MTQAPSSFVMVPREVAQDILDYAGDECWLDHHGNCQEHGLQPANECFAARLKQVLASAPPQEEVVAWLRDLQPDAEDEALAVCNKVDPGAFPVYRAQPVAVREALESAANWVQRYLDTFGELGDDATQANIDDWHALTVLPVGGDQKKSTAESGHQTEQAGHVPSVRAFAAWHPVAGFGPINEIALREQVDHAQTDVNLLNHAGSGWEIVPVDIQKGHWF